MRWPPFCVLLVAVFGVVALWGIGEEAENVGVTFMAPFFTGGGYCSEAISFVLGMAPHLAVRIIQHADNFNQVFFEGLAPAVQSGLIQLVRSPLDPSDSVVICHSEPGAWAPPAYQTNPCPPRGVRPLFLIGRTMFETDRTPKGWVKKLNKMDQIWVPTEHQRRIFEADGVTADRLRVVPEPVDVEFFSPEGVEPLEAIHVHPYSFKFVSVFKWETRKGWEFLLRAFVEEFTADDSVGLFILTNAFHSSNDFDGMIEAFLQRTFGDQEAESDARHRVHVVPSGLADQDMPRLYKAANAFVLPSRGEGWGRPHVEAMAMGLPVLATNWSGPTAFMTEANSYPIRVEDMDTIEEGAFAGHKWARPSVDDLKAKMRWVVEHPEEAESRGTKARQDMVELYCPECVTRILLEELQQPFEEARRRRARRKKRTARGHEDL